MSRAARSVAIVALIAAATTTLPAQGYAQAFGIRLERGEIGVDGRGLRQVEGFAAGSVSSEYQQWLRVPLSGFLVHPRVLRYAFSIRPLFGQHNGSTLQRSTHTRNIGLDFSSSLFPARRMSLSFQATRSSGSSSGEFGAQSDFHNESFSSVVTIRDRYFPTTLTYSNRGLRDTWENAFTAAPVQRDQRASRLRAEIRNKKLTAILEQSVYQDHRGTGDHEAFNAQARHRLEWGKGSSLLSNVNVYRRRGSGEINRTSWSERAFIEHTHELGTALSIGRQSWSRGDQLGRNFSYDASTRYSPAVAFEGALTVNGQRFRSGENGSTSRIRIAPSLRYTIELPRDARLNLSGSVGTERLSRSLPSDLLLDVIEESHEVDEGRSFSLEQLRIERASIEIWDETRTLLLQEGIDYRIIETGPLFEIQVLPGSRVQEGESVLVNYQYRSLAVEDLQIFYFNYETSLKIGELNLRHGRRQRSQNGSSTTGVLADPDDVDLWFGASYARRTRFGGLRLDAARRSRSAEEIVYWSNELRGELSLPRLGSVESRVRAATTRTVATEQVTRNTSAGGSLTWSVSRTVRFSAGLDGWIWTRDDQSPERFASVHSMVTWSFGQVNTVLSFDQVRRSNGFTHKENRWSARVVRRF